MGLLERRRSPWAREWLLAHRWWFIALGLGLLLMPLPSRAAEALPRAAEPHSQWVSPQPLRSGFETMGGATQAMQNRDSDNPAWFAVEEGARLYTQPAGTQRRSCAGCHGDARESLRVAVPLYPRFDETTSAPIDLSSRIEACRVRHQQAEPWSPEDTRRLALQAYLGSLARGLPLRPDPDPRLQSARARGQERFNQRIGQLGLSCADCHDRHWGQRLGGSMIPQGHPNAYPLWRLQWQAIGSLQRRVRACLTGVRAEPWGLAESAWVELELFLHWRGAGLSVETPGVRP